MLKTTLVPSSSCSNVSALQCIRMEIDLAASLFENEAIPLIQEQLRYDAAMWRPGRKAHLGLREFFAILAEFDTNGLKCRTNRFLEGLAFLASCQGMTTGQRDHNESFRHVRNCLVVSIFGQGNSTMNHIIMSALEVFHAGFNLGFPAGGVMATLRL